MNEIKFTFINCLINLYSIGFLSYDYNKKLDKYSESNIKMYACLT